MVQRGMCVRGVGALVGFVLITAIAAQAATIATFQDPAPNGGTPLFTIDLQAGVISAGWPDSQTGLNLNMMYFGQTFTDAYFTMTDLSYAGGLSGGATGGGSIKFFADGGAVPVFQIDFDSGQINVHGFGADDVFTLFGGDNVVFSGSLIENAPLPLLIEQESFAFSFANQTAIGGDAPANGYTATAAFTSSALVTEIPEPTTMVLLGLGLVWSVRRRRA